MMRRIYSQSNQFKYGLVLFELVSLYNSICGLFNAKSIILKEQ